MNDVVNEVFKERFGFVPATIEAEQYTTYLDLVDTKYSAEINGVTYTWSAAYDWFDED